MRNAQCRHEPVNATSCDADKAAGNVNAVRILLCELSNTISSCGLGVAPLL